MGLITEGFRRAPGVVRSVHPKERDGTVRVSQLRLFSPRLDHDLHPLLSELKRRDQWRERALGRMRLMLVRARDVYDAAVALADRGLFVRERTS